MKGAQIKLWSVASSAAIAILTLFVFWAFQNYGPESALRRFHVAVDRVNTYLPPSQPFDESLLKPLDRYELGQLSTSPLNSYDERRLIDGAVRRALYGGARYSVQRLLFRSSREAVAVVLYEFPQGGKGAAVFVLSKPYRAWQVNAKLTQELVTDMTGTTSRAF